MIHLRSLPSNEPVTAIGWVRWMWLEIQEGLKTGKTLKEVWEAARRDGLQVSYPQFRVYVSRIRRLEETGNAKRATDRGDAIIDQNGAQSAPGFPEKAADPLYNIRVQLEKKRLSTFEYNPFPDPKDSKQ
jgi:hypothetical protein